MCQTVRQRIAYTVSTPYQERARLAREEQDRREAERERRIVDGVASSAEGKI